jgi:hypothetical protein
LLSEQETNGQSRWSRRAAPTIWVAPVRVQGEDLEIPAALQAFDMKSLEAATDAMMLKVVEIME